MSHLGGFITKGNKKGAKGSDIIDPLPFKIMSTKGHDESSFLAPIQKDKVIINLEDDDKG